MVGGRSNFFGEGVVSSNSAMTGVEFKSKLLFFVTVDWFFCSHFLERAKAAKEAGYEVAVLCSVHKHQAVVELSGIRIIPLSIDRRSLNPFLSLLTLFRVIYVYRREKPDIVHQIALKPILLGGLAAMITRVPNVVNAIVGCGYLFISQKMSIRAIRACVLCALSFILKRPQSHVVFENSDDMNGFIKDGLVDPKAVSLIRGAGVNPLNYQHGIPGASSPMVVLTARLLWDKGVSEFVEAARLLHGQGVQARFVVVGNSDEGNRASIGSDTLGAWQTEGIVEFLGFRTDVPYLLEQASIACLPSYREGLPKALLEAMAAGLPCVTTDVPGCREAVTHGDNGLLVPAGDAIALAKALNILIQDVSLRQRMGQRGRERIEREFSSEIIIGQTLALYEDILAA